MLMLLRHKIGLLSLAALPVASCGQGQDVHKQSQVLTEAPATDSALPTPGLRGERDPWSKQEALDFGSVSRDRRLLQATWALRNPDDHPRRILAVHQPWACQRILLRRDSD